MPKNSPPEIALGSVILTKEFNLAGDGGRIGAAFASGVWSLTGSLKLSGPSHLISFEGATLAANCNAIRGASLNPTRASGWISFSGTVEDTPAQVYTDYRELHTTGEAEILGFGAFPFMDSGAECKSMFALQAICEVDAGATVLSADDAPAIGIFPLSAKCLLNNSTFAAGGVAACAFLSFQANGQDVKAEDTSILNMEVASGGIQNIIKFRCTSVTGATYLLNLADNGLPGEKTAAATTAVNNVVGNIKVLIGDQVGYINVHSAKAS